MHPTDADGIANNVDTDLVAVWSVSALFGQTYLSPKFKEPYRIRFELEHITTYKMICDQQICRPLHSL